MVKSIKNVKKSVSPSKNQADTTIKETFYENRWYFARTTENGNEVFLDICEECIAVRWNDYLIYENQNDYGNTEPQIKMFNLLNNKEELIFKYSDYKGDRDWGDNVPSPSINNMKVIDDALVFSLGNYVAEGGTYWIDLTNPKTANLIFKDQNSYIYQKNRKWWVLSGFGDGCGGYGEYRLLDESNMTIVSSVKYDYGCSEGDYVIGIDPTNNLILGFHTDLFNYTDIDGDDVSDGSYKYIELANINSPDVRTKVIPEANMPKGITEVFYVESDNRIWLIGNENYFFDLNTRELTKLEKDALIPNYQGLFEDLREMKWSDNLDLPRGFELNQKRIEV